MSVLANTLNAYAGKIKAQRKAAERLAHAQARAKSVEQQLADKMRIELERIQKQQQEKSKLTPTFGVEFFLDKVIRQMKNDHNEILLSGERARITQDLTKLAELFYYPGVIPGRVAHKCVDTTTYSTAAFAAMLGVLIQLKMVQEDGALEIVENRMRLIVCLRANGKCLITCINSEEYTVDQAIEEAKKQFLQDCRAHDLEMA